MPAPRGRSVTSASESRGPHARLAQMFRPAGCRCRSTPRVPRPCREGPLLEVSTATNEPRNNPRRKPPPQSPTSATPARATDATRRDHPAATKKATLPVAGVAGHVGRVWRAQADARSISPRNAPRGPESRTPLARRNASTSPSTPGEGHRLQHRLRPPRRGRRDDRGDASPDDDVHSPEGRRRAAPSLRKAAHRRREPAEALRRARGVRPRLS